FLDGGDGDPNGDGAYAKATTGQGPHEGTVYIVAGSPADVRIFSPGPHPAMLVSLENLGTAVIEVDGNTLVGKFINESGTILDTFQIEKGP
ncbi:MAG: metallophosphoesterase, partial [Deltaproteobacteria bacterium]|nr:metallophosphoesterase [Deltaproteobacteria bacterium]